jgi:hypothetical protein
MKLIPNSGQNMLKLMALHVRYMEHHEAENLIAVRFFGSRLFLSD